MSHPGKVVIHYNIWTDPEIPGLSRSLRGWSWSRQILIAGFVPKIVGHETQPRGKTDYQCTLESFSGIILEKETKKKKDEKFKIES